MPNEVSATIEVKVDGSEMEELEESLKAVHENEKMMPEFRALVEEAVWPDDFVEVQTVKSERGCPSRGILRLKISPTQLFNKAITRALKQDVKWLRWATRELKLGSLGVRAPNRQLRP